MARGIRHGIRKVCKCKPAAWAKCRHPWHFSYKWAGVHYRYSLDRLLAEPVRQRGEAEAAANDLRAAIQAGTFRAPDTVAPVAAASVADGPVLLTLTLAQLLDRYQKEYIAVRRPDTLQNDVWQIGVINRTVLTLPTGEARPLGEWYVADIKASTIEDFRTVRQQAARVAANRNLALLRAAFRWAIGREYVDVTPFTRGGVNVVKLKTEARRSRRLEPGEAERLLAACNATVRPIVEAALETACRRGEVLSLQWKQVRLDERQEIVLLAGKTKTKKERRVPITSRLKAILEMRRHDANGKEHGPDAFVFGAAATGQALRTFRRGWCAAVLRANGIKPQYVIKTVGERTIRTGVLTPECQAAFAKIDLHFHDLRREAASQWLDSGVIPLSTIQAWLGHANISQTSTYLQCQLVGQNDLMRRFEEQQAKAAKLPRVAPAARHAKSRGGRRSVSVN